MKLSARNIIKGTIVGTKIGPISSKVTVDIGGGNIITSVLTAESIDDLNLAPGKEVLVIIKSSSVMLATES